MACTARVQQLNNKAEQIKSELAVFLRNAKRTGVLDKKKLDGYNKRLQAVVRELEVLVR